MWKLVSGSAALETADYFNARKILTGIDQADKIADIVRWYSEILREAKV